MQCQRCLQEYTTIGNKGKYCPECRPLVIRERSARNYYNNVRLKIDNIDLKIKAREALAAARLAGETHYLGLRCKHGHLSKRLVSTQQCCECLRLRKIAMRVKTDSYLSDVRRNSIKRKLSKNLELTRFKSLLECKHGHMGERLVSTGQCCECLKLRTPLDSKNYKSSEVAIARFNSKRRSKAGRIRNRIYYKEKLSKCENFKLAQFIRGCVRRTLNHKAGVRSTESVGYDHFELKQHIESLFTDGMTWANYGEWHIDHIKSIQSHINDGVTDCRTINSLSNLQPLWQFDNLSKGSR